jgi:hypothetical protein
MDKWFAGELNRGQLEQALGGIFSPDRAARIGITETTQAVTMGKLRAADEMKMLGFVPHYIWHQNSDYDGCGCDVLDGTEVEEGLVPPLHVNCNCDIEVRYEIPEDPGENITMADVEALLAGKMATMAQYAVENALKAATA